MADNMDFECLSLSDQDYTEDVTEKPRRLTKKSKVYLQGPSNFESNEEEKSVKDLKHKSEAEKGNDTSIQTKIEAFPNAHAITKKVSVKTAADNVDINLSSAYRFKQQWKEEDTLLLS
ncbi:hypothetical protein RO3G_16832 [Rhizopus delemar RA 99-880]|uniref:Uncharacterized protein n=1 Tax=Rhizopus delemar (strain RA 99-880 / ATCC MYA-4621 / FGSC 9543 / NRRL 43880) TaxID=246409 RepID=I1CUJ1_RHIO9|nr:hypothetical protein RO3G_16832 [Rhizopus delemar RA 99-880]|eukprot:EIE92121.1 hypothetical protein RO3G_16832 [Rhizopus delemar RA 99-880]